MKTNLNTKTIFGIMILLAAVGLAVYSFLFRAMYKSHNRIVAYTEDVKRAENAVVEEAVLKRTVAEIGPDLEKVRSYYISADGVVGFIETLETLGRDSGVVAKIDSVDVMTDEATASSSVEALALSLVFDGTWRNSMRFLTLLEALPYDISITKFSLLTNPEVVAESGSVRQAGPLEWRGKAIFTVIKQK